jgi:epimerase transport system membrane fusion protein
MNTPVESDNHKINELADDRPIRRIGYFIVLGVFGGLGGWAALAPLDSAALAPGVIMVESYRKTVQHLEGGIVKEIRVHNGDAVEKGQVLMVLDDTQAKAQLETWRGQFFIALARETRLLAEREGKSSVTFPRELTNETADPRAKEAILVQEQTFRTRKNSHEGEIALLQQEIQQLGSKTEGLDAQIVSRKKLIDSLREEVADLKSLLSDGFADKQRIRELERQLAETEGQRADYIASLATTRIQISETKQKILQLTRDFQKDVERELEQVQSSLFELREKIQSLSDTVQRTVIKAPESGRAMGLMFHTIGGVVKPGENLLDIVPLDADLEIEAQVSPSDIDRIHKGQKAEVHVTAFKSIKLPKLYGEVTTVSADRFVDPHTGMPYYQARVKLEEASLEKLHAEGLELQPGMPSDVLIITGERTLFQYLSKPLTSFFRKSMIEP